jgi:hypothetical protein
MPNEHEGTGRKLVGLYEGPVVDNKDPKKLGRVKVNIPGVAEPTGWAFPLGWAGAGGKKRGGWSPPPVGAEVGVMFKMGDPDHPRYLPGFPGEGETPDEVEEASVEDAVKVPFVFNGDRFKIVMDERPGKARMAIEDKKTGDVYEIDGVKLGCRIKSTSALSIECDGAIDIKGSSVTINGRRVAPNGQPIS